MIDLHTHSTASDGLFAPGELINYAASKGISVIALTDHDTTSGLFEAEAAAKNNGITFIPGVELNIQWYSGEFHLLGLGLKKFSPDFVQIIRELQNSRETRNEQIIQKMRSYGFSVCLDDIKNISVSQSIGRPHFASYMVKNHIVKNRQQAFDRYLAKNRPWYVPHEGIDLDRAIAAIKESYGLPVLAHPLSLYISWGKLEPVLQNLHTRGICGLEAWHPGARMAECVRLEELARKLGFFVTAGSDFHGEGIRADRKIGYTSGNKIIEDRFWTDDLEPHLLSVKER
ncbi:MAG: PHP domain-containing protein [Treponema sp.]|jgi:predicted metal-dependent phosphoesterase TrpH|nr:PHP domain-containing protein [Treponema sp.]